MSRQNSLSRVHYFERQFLRTEDFIDEQSYHLAMRHRHNIAHHSWGIVSGLELVLAEDGVPAVDPGMAIDGYGRELILADQARLPISAFDERAVDELDAWLLYDRIATDPAPPGYVPRGVDQESFYRWQESPLVRLDRVDPTHPDPRRPASVPEGDLDFDPSRSPVDAVADDWPVFLGRIRRQHSDDGVVYVLDVTGRPHAGLVGAAVVAPGPGHGRLEIGGDAKDHQGRGASAFSVYLPDQDQAALELDDLGQLNVRGDANVTGDLEIHDGACEFGVAKAPVRRLPRDETERADGDVEQANPWRIYRAQTEGPEELRVEMGAGDNSQVVIGAWSAETQRFEPRLTVAADGNITIHGNLKVEGKIYEDGDEIQVTRRFKGEAEQILLSNFVSGVSASNVLFDSPPKVDKGS